MKRNHFLLLFVVTILVFTITACTTDDLIEEIVPEMESPFKNPKRVKANPNPKDFKVNIDMVNGYLKLTKRFNELRSIMPLSIDEDTLAWVVQYHDGWQVLSGDIRIAPVMISCEEGDFDLKELSPNSKAVNGLLYYIRDIHYSTDTLKNRVWRFLETSDLYQKKPNTPRRIGGEIMTRGMWVAVDSSFESSTSTQPHIIQTKWGQGTPRIWNSYAGPYTFLPWNGFTPTINDLHTYAGCVAVAACQLVYHYRKDDPKNITLPSDGYISGDNTIPTFSNYTTDVWSSMALSYNEPLKTKVKNVALFLSYLGNQIGSSYGLNGTSAGSDKIADALSDYLLDYSSMNSYSYNIVNNNLTVSKPVGVVASNTNNTAHAFIIDSKKEETEYYQVTYLWDNDYEVDYYEYNRLDPWRFEMPEEYDPLENNEVYYYYTVDHSLSVSFAMNWGWDGYCDNCYYSASMRNYPLTDQYGYYPGSYYEYQPYWAADGRVYNNVTRLVYNIHEQL